MGGKEDMAQQNSRRLKLRTIKSQYSTLQILKRLGRWRRQAGPAGHIYIWGLPLVIPGTLTFMAFMLGWRNWGVASVFLTAGTPFALGLIKESVMRLHLWFKTSRDSLLLWLGAGVGSTVILLATILAGQTVNLIVQRDPSDFTHSIHAFTIMLTIIILFLIAYPTLILLMVIAYLVVQLRSTLDDMKIIPMISKLRNIPAYRIIFGTRKVQYSPPPDLLNPGRLLGIVSIIAALWFGGLAVLELPTRYPAQISNFLTQIVVRADYHPVSKCANHQPGEWGKELENDRISIAIADAATGYRFETRVCVEKP